MTAVGFPEPGTPSVPSVPSVPDRLWEEIVYIAYYLHWSFDSILELDHLSRARVIEEIARINVRLGAEPEAEDWEG